jgi:ATP-dependent Clp protease protease subunit
MMKSEKIKKFWNIANGNEIILDGYISETSWYGDESGITPKAFKEDLESLNGDITVDINSPGGDVFAASSIYSMIKEYKGKVTVKITCIAASAASVVAMAGDKVLINPTGYMMIHNPSMVAIGEKTDMEIAAKALDEIKEGIINAYAKKTGKERDEISKMMDDETWMSAQTAIEMGFADGVLYDDTQGDKKNTDNDEPQSVQPENKVNDCLDLLKAKFNLKLLYNGGKKR